VFKLTGASGLDFWGGYQDERDNDGDGLADFPLDPGCASPTSSTESPACSNGVDDDRDGRIDGADPGCSGPAGASEFTPSPGWGCGIGPELALLLPVLRLLRRRRAGGALGLGDLEHAESLLLEPPGLSQQVVGVRHGDLGGPQQRPRQVRSGMASNRGV
jgi:hypothetical protein